MASLSEKTVLIKETIFEGKRFVLQKVEIDGKIYLLKTAKPWQQVEHLLRNEYQIGKRLEHIPDVRKVHALFHYQGKLALLLEYVPWKPLQSYIEKPWDIEPFLTFAIQIAKVLHQVHEAQVCHKDINPTNILYNPEQQRLKLIDFSISTYLGEGLHLHGVQDRIEGTYAYMAPEQTGRLYRMVDYRADLYSLGVVFYQLLTGSLPFEVDNPELIIYAHLSQIPLSPKEKNEEVPEVLSEIVMKLLAKAPEDRYQTALGLLNDLKKCLQQWKKSRSIEPFPLGALDKRGQLDVPSITQYYPEFQERLTTWLTRDKASTSVFYLHLPEGIPAQPFIDQVYTAAIGHKITPFVIRCDTHQRPLAPFNLAFERFLQQLLSGAEETLQRWKEKFLEHLQGFIPYLQHSVPSLAKVITEPIETPTKQETETEAIQDAYYNLIRFFQEEQGELLFILYPAEQLEPYSIKFLLRLLQDKNLKKVFFLFISHTAPEQVAFLKTLPNYLTYTLPQPSLEMLNRFVADALQMPEEETYALTKVLTDRVGANVEMITALLQHLIQKGILSFNTQQQRWQWQEEQIKTAPLPESVAQLLQQNIESLPQEAQTLLKQIACFGDQITLQVLLFITQQSTETLKPIIEQCLHAKLLITNLSDLSLLTSEEPEEIVFQLTHSALRRVLLKLLTKEEKQRYYERILQYFFEVLSPEEREQQVFTIAEYLMEGMPSNPSLEMLMFLLYAAKVALTTGEAEKALQYAQKTIKALPEKTLWKQYPSLAQETYLTIAKASVALHKMEYFEEALKNLVLHQTQPEQLLQLYQLHIQSLAIVGDYEEALAVARNVLKTFLKLEIPQKVKEREWKKLLWELRAKLFVRNIWGGLRSVLSIGPKKGATPAEELALANIAALARAKEVRQPSVIATLQLLHNAFLPALLLEPETALWIVLQFITKSIEEGKSAISAVGYTLFGAVLSKWLDDEHLPAKALSQVAEAILEEYPGAIYEKIYAAIYRNVFILHWHTPIKELLPKLKEGYQSSYQQGLYHFSNFTAVYHVVYGLIQGETLVSLLKTTRDYLNELQSHATTPFTQTLELLQQLIEQLHRIEAQELPSLKEVPKNFLGQIQHFLYLYVFLCKGAYTYAAAHGKNAYDYLHYTNGTALHWATQYYYALALLHLDTLSEEQKGTLETLLQRFQKYQKYYEDFAIRYRFLMALKLRQDGKLEEAQKQLLHLENALQLSFLEQGLLHENLVKIALLQGNMEQAALYLSQAFTAYERWGAHTRIAALKQIHQSLMPSVATYDPHHTTTTLGTTTLQELKQIDSLVVHLAETIAKQPDVDKIMERLIYYVLINTGAERVIILMDKEQRLIVKAVCDSEHLTEPKTHLIIPIEQYEELPHSIVTYVHRTHTPLKVAYGSEQYVQFQNDPYLQQYEPKGLYLYPIRFQGKWIGILYLEHRKVSDVLFHEQVEQVLKALQPHVGMLLWHYQMKEEMEKAIAQRTQALEEAQKVLTARTLQLERQKRIIENYNQRLEAGIKYASRIQRIILHSEVQFKQRFPKGFVLWQPADVLSGDFFFAWQKGTHNIIIVGDCTGHGIPASLLTILGTVTLHRIIVNENVYDPVTILQRLNEEFYAALSAELEKPLNDGMDVAVVVINQEKKTLTYAGARMPIVLIQQDQLQVLTPSKHTIGEFNVFGLERSFEAQQIIINDETKVYMFSDGYKDQFGGIEGKKLGAKRFYSLLQTVANLPWEEQKKHLWDAHLRWRGNKFPQTDDIIVLGFAAMQ